ncbi:unnamed protein product [Rotaria magnacalcarata]|uniref:Uncharacterized protein n=1 Tax=Rotaria magnacalcarata TaxID=392030 RepID=A0A819CNR4_9BILA|nr:unnamed protein product [Rotaria magnacalcarata]CAF4632417.1 unnamed protein product [Rotaria magnacalcarata]
MSYQISVTFAILCLLITILAVNLVESVSETNNINTTGNHEENITSLILIASAAKIKTFKIDLDATSAAETYTNGTSWALENIENPSQPTMEAPGTSTKGNTHVSDGNKGNVPDLILIASVAKIKTFKIDLDATSAAETYTNGTSWTLENIENPSQPTMKAPGTSTKGNTHVSDGNKGNVPDLILIASVAKIKTFKIDLDTTSAAKTSTHRTSGTPRNTANPSQSTMEAPGTSTEDSSATKNSLHSLFILVMAIKIII